MSGVGDYYRAFGVASGLAIALLASALGGGVVFAQESSPFAGNTDGKNPEQVIKPVHAQDFGGTSNPDESKSHTDLSGDLFQVLTRGYKALSDEDYGAARLYFKRATELAPDRADLWLQLGYIELNLDSKEAAIAAMERAYELDPTNNLIPSADRIYPTAIRLQSRCRRQL